MKRGWNNTPVAVSPPPGWRRIRYWHAPAPEYPTLHVAVWMNQQTGVCRAVLVSDIGVAWSKVVHHPRHWTVPADGGWSQMASFVRKVVAKEERRAAALDAAAQQWSAGHPALWEYMTLDEFEPGQPRETSMLMVFVEDNRFKACLQDRQEGRSLWATSPTLEGALEALEAHLAAGTGDWRQMKGQHAKGRSRR